MSLLATDSAGNLVAGLKGETFYDYLFVQYLAVAPTLRGTGIGSRLLEQAEDEAKRRGCRYAYLNTFDFCARPFYEKRGYRLFGTLPNYPGKHLLYFLVKDLKENA